MLKVPTLQVETLALQKSHKEGGQRTGLWSGRYEPSYGARQEELVRDTEGSLDRYS